MFAIFELHLTSRFVNKCLVPEKIEMNIYSVRPNDAQHKDILHNCTQYSGTQYSGLIWDTQDEH